MTQVSIQPELLQAPRHRLWVDLAVWVICLVILAWLASVGVHLQRNLWQITTPVRFGGDINNAYNQGSRAHRLGLLSVYDNVASEGHYRPDGVIEYSLDYPPLRLTAAWLWYEWCLKHYGDGPWQNTYEFHTPLLMMNRTLLAIAAISAAGVVWHVRRHCRPADQPPRPSTGAIPATFASTLAWFCPPALVIGFTWPQWDIYVPALFLAALFAACRNCWFIAGMLFAAGGMYKGQLFLSVITFVIWPLFAGRWSAIPRFLLGLFFAATLIVTPFTLHYADAWLRPELLTLILSAVFTWLASLLLRTAYPVAWYWKLVPALLGAGLMSMGTRLLPHAHFAWLGLFLGLTIVGTTLLIPRRYQLIIPATAVASCILLTALCTPASWNWLRVGLLFGTEHFPRMIIGTPSNLPALFERQFGIPDPNTIAFTGPHDWQVKWGMLLKGVFLLGMIVGAIAMGIHDRRRNRRFLVAAVVPWLCFVTFCPQNHERYILYPALVSSILVGVDLGWAMLAIALQLIAVLPPFHVQLICGNHAAFLSDEIAPGVGSRILQAVSATHPGIAWALITVTCICIYCALDFRRPATAPT